MNLKDFTSCQTEDLLAQTSGSPLMTLMPEGMLIINPDETYMVKDFMVYTNNSVYMSANGMLDYVGKPLTEPVTLDAFRSKLVINEVEASGCMVHTAEPILAERDHFLVYCRYKDSVVLVVADSDISRGAMLSAMEYTPEEDAFMRHIFLSLVARHDAELSVEVAKRHQDLMGQIKRGA